MTKGNRRILFFVPYGSHLVHNQLDAVVATALRVRGCEVVAVLCDGIFHNCHVTVWSKNKAADCQECAIRGAWLFSSVGVPTVQLRQFLTADDLTTATQWTEGLNPSEYENAVFDGHPIGSWALSPIYSRFRIKADYQAHPEVCAVYKQYLQHSVLAVRALTRIYDAMEPDAVCMWSGWANPYRVAFELGRARGLPIVTHERGANFQLPGGTFRVVANDFPGRNSMFLDAARRWKNVPMSTADLEAVRDLFVNHERNLGNGMYQAPTDASDVRPKLRIPTHARVVGIFTSGDYETSTHPDFKDAPDQLVMLEALLKELETFNCYVVVRHHPNMASRQGMKGESDFIARAYQLAAKSGPRVRTIMPHEELTSYGLLWTLDAVISFYSSVSIEAAFRAIPSMLLECSPYADGLRISMPTQWEGGSLTNTIKSLLASDNTTTLEDFRRLYRHMFSILFKTEKVFKSFAIKDQYHMDIRVQSVEDLLPGKDPELDNVCSFLVDGAELSSLPSIEQVARSTAEEDVFLKRELGSALELRASMLQRSLQSHVGDSLGIGLICLTDKATSIAPSRELTDRSRHSGVRTYRCPVSNILWATDLKIALAEVREEFVAIAACGMQHDEAFFSTGLDALMSKAATSTPANAVFSAVWLLEEKRIVSELFTRYNPVPTRSELSEEVTTELELPLLISRGIYRKAYLASLLDLLIQCGDLEAQIQCMIERQSDGDNITLSAPLVLVDRRASRLMWSSINAGITEGGTNHIEQSHSFRRDSWVEKC